jgi:signal transduction histidine kinase
MLSLFQQKTFGEISPEMEQAIAVMIRSNQNLMDMVNTLLEVYRFEAGKKTLNLILCDLEEIVIEVVDELQPLAQEKKLSLSLNPDNLPPSVDNGNTLVIGDPLELRRVLNNLVGNAIKFTDTGGVEVRLLANQNTVIIEIIDTGYGIALEDQANIFERFRQGKNKRSGSGLGLHLSRRIVEAHGGEISLISSVGQGSTFQVKLPKGREQGTGSREYRNGSKNLLA